MHKHKQWYDITIEELKAENSALKQEIETIGKQSTAIALIQSSGSSPEQSMAAGNIARMLSRYVEHHCNLGVTTWHYVGHEISGLMSTILVFEGENAQEILDKENGIHRMVFNSPFDEEGRRHTVFTLVKTKQMSLQARNMGAPSPAEEPIRSYILHPYTLAIDHRTKKETDDVTAVLDGEIYLIQERSCRAVSDG